MSASSPLLTRIGRSLDRLRRVLANALLLALLVGLVALAASLWRGRPRIPPGAALVLNPSGSSWTSSPPRPRRAWPDVLRASPPARPRRGCGTSSMPSASQRTTSASPPCTSTWTASRRGMSKLRTIREALLDFKASGKPVVGYSQILTQRRLLSSGPGRRGAPAPEGLLMLQGFGGHRPYYREGLDRYGIDVHVFRVGEYKSAVEPFLRSDMSPEAREAASDVYGDLWRIWLADVGEARDLAPEAIHEWVDTTLEQLRAAKGDAARAALDFGLVDRLAHRDEARARMIELVGENDEETGFRQVSWRTYLAVRADDREPRKSGDGVAVVVAAGEVLNGEQPAGRIGGRSTARLIRQARRDESRQGHRPPGRQPRRERLRLGADPPGVHAGPGGRQAPRRLHGKRRRLGGLLHLRRRRRDLGPPLHDHRVDRHLRPVSPRSPRRSRATSGSPTTAWAPPATPGC